MGVFFTEVRKSLRILAPGVLLLLLLLLLLLIFGVIGAAWCRKLGDCTGFLQRYWKEAEPVIAAGALTLVAAVFFLGGWGAAERARNLAARIGWVAFGIVAAGGVWLSLLAAYVWLDNLRQ